MKQAILIVLFLAFIIGLIPSITNAKLVTCVGDSITYGYGLPDRESDCYPTQLAEILQSFGSEWETKNFGANGATLLRNGDQPYIAKGVYNPALASEPDVVIIMLGTNDSWPSNWVHKDDFIPDYLALIDAFAELPSNPKIFICCPPPIWGNQWGLDGTVLKDEIIPLISEVAELRDVGVIDLHTPLEDSIHLFSDGVHPNAEGARMMAEIVASMILGFRFSPDLDGDYKVDIEDLVILIEHWDQNEPLCDIAPPPFGDGIVDRKDLEVFMSHWGEDYTFLAHWKLDEAIGDIAHDSIGENDGTVYGDPNWQPDGGMVDGALEFDGINDYVSTPFILNPNTSPLSVFAWIKGGLAGQTIISQVDGANWLSANTSNGSLMTELKGGGRTGSILVSQTVITDNDWHRIGLTWDGANRILYVDDIVAAIDTQANLEGSEGGLYIGAGYNFDVGTFWTGLIDNVRIYNRAITP